MFLWESCVQVCLLHLWKCCIRDYALEILVDPVQLSFTAARHSVFVRSLAPDTTLTSFLAECESKTRQSRKTVENFRTSRILMMLEYCLLSEVRLYSMEPGRMGISWLRQGSGWVERSDGVWGVISLCMLLKVNMAHKQEWPESVGRIRNHSPTWMCFSMP